MCEGEGEGDGRRRQRVDDDGSKERVDHIWMSRGRGGEDNGEG